MSAGQASRIIKTKLTLLVSSSTITSLVRKIKITQFVFSAIQTYLKKKSNLSLSITALIETNMSKAVNKILSVSANITAYVDAFKIGGTHLFYRTLEVVAKISPVSVRRTQTTKSAAAAIGTEVTRETKKIVSAAAASAAIFVSGIWHQGTVIFYRTVEATAKASVSVRRHVLKIVSVRASIVGSVIKKIYKSLAATSLVQSVIYNLTDKMRKVIYGISSISILGISGTSIIEALGLQGITDIPVFEENSELEDSGIEVTTSIPHSFVGDSEITRE
jgi:hypothetical protein